MYNLEISYTNSTGETVRLSGASGYVHCVSEEFSSSKLTAENITASGATFPMGSGSLTCTFGIDAPTETEGLKLRYEIQKVTSVDASSSKPGRLTVNGWYLPCYVSARSFEKCWWDGRFCEFDLTFSYATPIWRKKKTVYVEDTSKKITNNGALPAYMVIRCYYPLPSDNQMYITIGGHARVVSAELAEGEYIEVDTENQTLIQRGNTSVQDKDLMGTRIPDNYSYSNSLFMNLEKGTSTVLNHDDLYIEIDVIETALEPLWN